MRIPTTLLALSPAWLLGFAWLSPAAPHTSQDPDEILRDAEAALELQLDDPELLAAAADAAAENDDVDRALWYASLALDHSSGGKDERERDERMRKILGEHAGDAPLTRDLQAEQAAALLDLAKAAERKKLYVNAVDLLGRCQSTSAADDAAARLEKLFSKKKAVAALLASGVDVPVSPRRKKKPAEIERFDAKHASWDKPAEFKGKFYTVRTDMGYAYGTAFLEAMEQMNSFYREVFDYKTGGQTMRRCILHVYSSRAVFEAQEPSMQGKPGTKGFFVPGENRVAAYDQRTDGGTIDDLWSTLFHEASHQFTRAVWPGLIPTWLNEGTASYFEGAVLKPGGRVEKNLVPHGRLLNLRRFIQSDEVALKDVITYFRPGSYPGEYYPYGWGLVYFCHNYEDENAQRPYLPVYRALMESYVGAPKHNVFDRFNEYFVDRADIEGVESFEDFEAKWEEWIEELAEVTFGGAEQADVWTERGRRQLNAERPVAAAESARRALAKRPEDARALVLLAEALVELEQTDGALLAWRQLDQGALALAAVDPERCDTLRAQAQAGMAAADAGFAEAYAAREAALAVSAQAAATAWVEAGSPRVALEVLRGAQELLGRSADLGARAKEIREEFDVSIARWEALPFGDGVDSEGNSGRWRVPVGWSVEDGALLPKSRGLSWCHWGESVPAPFRVAMEIELPSDRSGTFIGVAYSGDFDSRPMAFVLDLENSSVGVLGDTRIPSLVPRGNVELGQDTVSLLVEVDESGARLYLDDEEVAFEPTKEGDPAPGGAVGIVSQGEDVSVTQFRLQQIGE